MLVVSHQFLVVELRSDEELSVVEVLCGFYKVNVQAVLFLPEMVVANVIINQIQCTGMLTTYDDQ